MVAAISRNSSSVPERTTRIAQLANPAASPSATLAALLIAAAEERQEQEEHVQDVKEDRRGEKRRGADVLVTPEPLEVVQGQPAQKR